MRRPIQWGKKMNKYAKDPQELRRICANLTFAKQLGLIDDDSLEAAEERCRQENARRQALAAANDLIRVYSMLDIKLNRGLLDNIMLLGLHHAVEPLEAGAEHENWEIP